MTTPAAKGLLLREYYATGTDISADIRSFCGLGMDVHRLCRGSRYEEPASHRVEYAGTFFWPSGLFRSGPPSPGNETMGKSSAAPGGPIDSATALLQLRP